jgi:anti-anti-sigma regulatory factor
VVVAILLFMTGPLQYLPRCVLAGIVFTIAVGLIDVASLRDIVAESPGEFILALVTGRGGGDFRDRAGNPARRRVVAAAARTPQLPAAHDGARPGRDRTLGARPGGAGRADRAGNDRLPFRRGSLLRERAALRDEVRSLVKRAPTPVRWLVVDAGAITALDYSAARMLRELRDELAQSGVELIFARVSPYLRADMERHRITTALGRDADLRTLHEAVDSVRAPSRDAGLRNPDA